HPRRRIGDGVRRSHCVARRASAGGLGPGLRRRQRRPSLSRVAVRLLEERPDFNGAVPEDRALRRDLLCLFDILRLDQEEAAKKLLRLKKWPVSGRCRTFANAKRDGGLWRIQRLRQDEMAA